MKSSKTDETIEDARKTSPISKSFKEITNKHSPKDENITSSDKNDTNLSLSDIN
jgi:hypothetical protein